MKVKLNQKAKHRSELSSNALKTQTCKAWMSYMTKLVGPPLEIGMFDNILARVKAVATSPSSSIRSNDPVGKKGNTNVNEATNRRGSAYMTDSCSKTWAGELNDAKKATCWPRSSSALFINIFGNPSAKDLDNHKNWSVTNFVKSKKKTKNYIHHVVCLFVMLQTQNTKESCLRQQPT